MLSWVMRPVGITPTKKEGGTTMESLNADRGENPALKTAWGENPALSYRNLRAIIGYIGLTLPVVLLLAGIADGHLESSISTYYYTKVGNVFTGALCVIGIFLLAYRLTSWAVDNIATSPPASPRSVSRSSTLLRRMPRWTRSGWPTCI